MSHSRSADADAACSSSFSVRSRVRRGLAGAALALVPAGYFVIAAYQSHNVAAARELGAEQAGLVPGAPSAVQQSVYRVPVPTRAGDTAFFEANSWTKDTLYVQFATTAAGLTEFLRRLGARPADLRAGRRAVSVPAAMAVKVPWVFPPGHRWAGMTLTSRSPHPSYEITVNMDTPDRPTVFVTSVIRFAAR